MTEIEADYLRNEKRQLELRNIEIAKAYEELKKENKILERRILRSKECMKKLLFIVKTDHLNCKGLIQDAEDFIHDRVCPIRKLGQHCITEKPCIMCDKE